MWVLPAQILRSFLFATALFPFYRRIAELKPWVGGLALMSLILVMGYIAASGGIIEHFVFFNSQDYPLKFALITLVEISTQAFLMGMMIVWLGQRFIKNSIGTEPKKQMSLERRLQP
jgi:hypothetical protein